MDRAKPLGALACVVVGFFGLFVPALAGALIVVLVAVMTRSRSSKR